MATLEPMNVFQTHIFTVKKEEFLSDIERVGNRYLLLKKDEGCQNYIYPVCQTDNIFNEDETKDFKEFITQSVFAILDSEGYDMRGIAFSFNDMWVQEHRTTSGHERHSHPGSIFSGFYFIKVPKNSSRAIFYDPRPAKEYGFALPQKNANSLTPASSMINIEPEEGMFIFAPAWLHHSFTRNESSDPFIMVHFDLFAHSAPESEQKGPIII
jgi:uncharacterized protein (TIGR02466 family)